MIGKFTVAWPPAPCAIAMIVVAPAITGASTVGVTTTGSVAEVEALGPVASVAVAVMFSETVPE